MRVVTTVFSLFILCAGLAPAAARTVVKLPSGAQVTVADVQETTGKDGKKGIKALLDITGLGEIDDDQRSEVADRFFQMYFGRYAEQKKYQRAELGLGSSGSAEGLGSGGFTTVATFRYERAENGVWHPGHDSVLDDDPVENAQKVTLPSGAVIHLEFQGTAFVYSLQGEAFLGAFWTDIPLSDIDRVYLRAREYWTTVKGHVPANVPVASVAICDTPKLGFFHFREALVITLRRLPNGSWPEMPPTWGGAQRGRSGLIQATFREDRIKTIWPEQ